jgi:hypothetical protein
MVNKKLLYSLLIISPAASVSLLLLLMSSTNPKQFGPGGILLFFVLLYLCIVSVSILLYSLVDNVMSFVMRKRHSNRQLGYRLVSVVALGPVFLLGFNTLGRLEVAETVLTVLLVVLGCFYVVKVGVGKKQ